MLTLLKGSEGFCVNFRDLVRAFKYFYEWQSNRKLYLLCCFRLAVFPYAERRPGRVKRQGQVIVSTTLKREGKTFWHNLWERFLTWGDCLVQHWHRDRAGIFLQVQEIPFESGACTERWYKAADISKWKIQQGQEYLPDLFSLLFLLPLPASAAFVPPTITRVSSVIQPLNLEIWRRIEWWKGHTRSKETYARNAIKQTNKKLKSLSPLQNALAHWHRPWLR